MGSAEVLEALLNSEQGPLKNAFQCYKLSLNWSHYVGKSLAAVSKPVSYYQGVLRIHVKNASWLQQIHYSKRDILEALQNRSKELVIQDIYFAVGDISPAAPQSSEPSL